jgi:hypothetical protein
VGERSRETGMVPGGSDESLSLTGRACQREMLPGMLARTKGHATIVMRRVHARQGSAGGPCRPQDARHFPPGARPHGPALIGQVSAIIEHLSVSNCRTEPVAHYGAQSLTRKTAMATKIAHERRRRILTMVHLIGTPCSINAVT